MFYNKLTEFVVTFSYIGKIKYCPGTFGSLAAFPLCYLIFLYCSTENPLAFLFTNFSMPAAQTITTLIIAFLSCILLFIIGVYFSSHYSKHIRKEEDPSEVVIDEIVGQMLTIILTSFSVLFIHWSGLTQYLSEEFINWIFIFILPFILFRFFDIIKPWPINWCDKNIKGGIGIMLDDVLAAIFASVLQYAITFIIIEWSGYGRFG
ncbi:phosphatidylglycerophosphatase A [Candidatus Tisiphia endosymbiont of Nemotelus uliginosus]|uniref:phosphatidylglycerophosphatase A family protein n=1 Tax=Candidatus Tisiphia endosymbiont of Nemotelus uliginosus TaxID=3077926 RepID=UPI0035C92403